MSDLVKADRPLVLGGVTVKVVTGCGSMYVQLNYHQGRLFEVFATLGQGGGCAAAQSQALTKCVTLGLKCGVPAEGYIKYMRGIRCPFPVPWPKEKAVMSCPDGIAWAMEKYGCLPAQDVVDMFTHDNNSSDSGSRDDSNNDGGIPAAVAKMRESATVREEQGLRDVGIGGLTIVLDDDGEE